MWIHGRESGSEEVWVWNVHNLGPSSRLDVKASVKER